MREATIQKIKSVKPVENADRLDVVSVLGWNVVVRKGQFKEGDLVVYVEIDSLLPSDNPDFAFMENYHYRVRVAKLKGQISSGLVFPISILKNAEIIIQEGLDVSDILNITHYEKPIPMTTGGIARGNFPLKYIQKTDEVRLQNVPDVLDEIIGVELYETSKLDGTSATFVIYDNDYHVCSRNLSFKYDDEINNDKNIYVIMNNKYDLEYKLRNYDFELGIQGEICGPGIQKNRLGLDEVELFVFNVWNSKQQTYLDFSDMIKVCEDLKLKTVPIVNNSLVFNEHDDNLLNFLINHVKGNYDGTKNKREGSVFRSVKETYSPSIDGRLSFKVLNNDYLLSEES